MSGWRSHTGTAVTLDMENVETDQLIPARFMSTPRSEGYGRFLLHDIRFDPDGHPDPAFPLHSAKNVSVLIGRRNFGSGSSREAAVYALMDYGIRCVIAPSFGDIFASNSVNNGLLPALISEADTQLLATALQGEAAQATVSIPDRTVTVAGLSIAFTLSEAWAQKLLNGWDDVDLTEQHREAISAYRTQRATALPWVFPVPGTAGE